MKSGWRIGSVFGIPLLIDASWFLIVGLVTFNYGYVWQQENWGTGIAWIAGFAMALLLFTSVLLHELGHSLVARSQGISVNSITLFMFGGIASIDEESKTPKQAFQVAIAGPAVSFALFLLLMLVDVILPLSGAIAAIVQGLAAINLVLALFNMIPGLPLDGGQVLKAAIWQMTGSRIKGIRWAARAGQLLGWLAIAVGIFSYLNSFQSGLWIALLGWFGLRNANAYTRVTELQEILVSLNAATVMTPDYRVVDADLTLRQFADNYLLLEESSPVFFAASDGRYRGLIQTDELKEVDRSEWDTRTVNSIVRPLSEIASVTEAASLSQVIEALETDNTRSMTVLSPAGAVAGVIDRGDVVRAIAQRMNVPISDAIIKQIKSEGAYPPGLQLAVIAKSIRN